MASFARTWPTSFFFALVRIVPSCFVSVVGMTGDMRIAALVAAVTDARGRFGWPRQSINVQQRVEPISAIG